MKRSHTFRLESPVSEPEKSHRSRHACKWWEATFRGIKLAKSAKRIQNIQDLPKIVAKHKGIPYPVHWSKNRESQVTKVAKSGDSAKHRYSLDGPESRNASDFAPKPIQSAGAETEPRAKTPIQSAPRKRSKNGNFSETAKYQECTPASRFTPKFVLRLATGTDTRGDVPTQSWPTQYFNIYFTQV